MPIKKNNRFHDFEWEFEPKESNQEEISFSLRYHETDDYGPTVSMLNEDNTVGFSFPAEFFQDIAVEVNRVDRVNGTKTENPVATPMPQKPTGTVNFPVITNSTNGPMFKTGSQQAEEPVAVTAVELPNIEDMEEIEQPEGGFVSFSANKTEVETEVISEAPSELPALSNKEIMEERGTSPEDWMKQRAKRGKKASKKAIKKLK